MATTYAAATCGKVSPGVVADESQNDDAGNEPKAVSLIKIMAETASKTQEKKPLGDDDDVVDADSPTEVEETDDEDYNAPPEYFNAAGPIPPMGFMAPMNQAAHGFNWAMQQLWMAQGTVGCLTLSNQDLMARIAALERQIHEQSESQTLLALLRSLPPHSRLALATPDLCTFCANYANVVDDEVICDHCVFKVQAYHARCCNITCRRINLPFVGKDGKIARFCSDCAKITFTCTKRACGSERLPGQRKCAECQGSK